MNSNEFLRHSLSLFLSPRWITFNAHLWQAATHCLSTEFDDDFCVCSV